MAELMEVQPASKLGLLQVGSNVLVGHLLHACLDEIRLLGDVRHWLNLNTQQCNIPLPHSMPVHHQ